MRIISGDFKGRTILVRKNFPSRPTTDFAKENLFNILNNQFDFEEVSVLDLFSGTGSISYEFASRGCENIISIESDFRSFSFIRSTVSELKISSIKTIKMDAYKYIDKCEEQFDIVFADPPYDLKTLANLPEKVIEAKIIKKGGWFILEHGKNHQFNDNQYLINKRSYGSVHFSIFEL